LQCDLHPIKQSVAVSIHIPRPKCVTNISVSRVAVDTFPHEVLSGKLDLVLRIRTTKQHREENSEGIPHLVGVSPVVQEAELSWGGTLAHEEAVLKTAASVRMRIRKGWKSTDTLANADERIAPDISNFILGTTLDGDPLRTHQSAEFIPKNAIEDMLPCRRYRVARWSGR
jgi:hypothetical protein